MRNNYYERIFEEVLKIDEELEVIIDEVRTRLNKYSDNLLVAAHSEETNSEDLFYILITRVFNYALELDKNIFADVVAESIFELYNIIVVEGRRYSNYTCAIRSIVTNAASKAESKFEDINGFEFAYVNDFEAIELHNYLLQNLKSLSENERKVIELRYDLSEDSFYIKADNMTLAEIGTIIGVGQERVRQIEAIALRKLRHPMHSRRLSDYRECLF